MTAMDEYVTKEQVINWFKPHRYFKISFDTLVGDLRVMKAADVSPVRHGRWIMGTGENGLQTGHRKCSRCGEIVKYGYSLYGVHNFCNYCGAKMDGDDVNG